MDAGVRVELVSGGARRPVMTERFTDGPVLVRADIVLLVHIISVS